MVHGVACGKTLILYASLIQADTMSAYSNMDFDADLLASRKEELVTLKNILQRKLIVKMKTAVTVRLPITWMVNGGWKTATVHTEELIAWVRWKKR